MKARIKWIEGATFVGESGSGHAMVMDGPPDSGGRNLGIRPMEMPARDGWLYGVRWVYILGKARQAVTDCVVELEAERVYSRPVSLIHVHFVSGDGLSEKQVARAIQLSAERYCSASIMLSKTVDNT
jgi:putative redox protein